MTEGYAAQPGGDLPLFHALMIIHQMQRLPAPFAQDIDYVRLMLDLSDKEFEEALDVCERYQLIRFTGDPIAPVQ
ncbi:MAG: hypothetical protein JNL34_10670 [Anaerolineae bacterium]|nr:hypothetical protein [Anaerolineae bacterium]